ncbi:MAG TPA: cyclase family protein [Terriglobales bacterium]|nr:cyclase family protein [Terriglobales bacterium]
MSCRVLKVQAVVVGAVLSIAMLLFAAHRHDSGANPQFRTVVDLTASATPGRASSETTLVSPAKLGGTWNIDSLPASRLIAPIAVIEAEHKNFPDSESLVTMDDVATFERVHGAIPQGAVILLASAKPKATPVIDHDALHFLIEARNVVGIGNAGTRMTAADENSYLAMRGIYELENVDNLPILPRSGAIAVAAPEKITGAQEAPARLMALVK